MIPTNTTTTLLEQLQLQNEKVWRIYKNMGTMHEALKNQVIDTIEYMYLKELKNKYTSFPRVRYHDVIEHLIDQYGKIMTVGIKYNNQQMNYMID